ncbi:hypothetical protein [Solitalea koreensis]|uniref:Uncharacterized protein n=1 Tax=Solitalea koreensis TaxID=543615 RepID=A0A521BKP5_9SPHI|nr:hypothetical protein [Solitalea koreensis]SMO47662.1 hypothetical protein SAMN06265350_102277 [Solitalea koreensis]
MTPSKKEVKKSSKKILETNIALKIKEALKDLSNVDAKKVSETIRDASKKIAKSVIKASKATEKESSVQQSIAAPKPEISKMKATKVVARVKEITGTQEKKEEKSIIKAGVLPAVVKNVSDNVTPKPISTNKKTTGTSIKASPITSKKKNSTSKGDKPTEGTK